MGQIHVLFGIGFVVAMAACSSSSSGGGGGGGDGGVNDGGAADAGGGGSNDAAGGGNEGGSSSGGIHWDCAGSMDSQGTMDCNCGEVPASMMVPPNRQQCPAGTDTTCCYTFLTPSSNGTGTVHGCQCGPTPQGLSCQQTANVVSSNATVVASCPSP